MTQTTLNTDTDTGRIAEARRREMAIEHLLFGTIRFVARRHPELLDEPTAASRISGTRPTTMRGTMRLCAPSPAGSSRVSTRSAEPR